MINWCRIVLLVIVPVVMLGFMSGGCSHTVAGSADADPLRIGIAFDENRAWSDLQQQVAFGFRIPGTEAHRTTRDWLVSQLMTSSTNVTLQPFSAVLNGTTVQMWNIVAQYPAKIALSKGTILLAAHWDTRPTADHDPDLAKRKLPISGANDGASGVAVLLEIARQLKANPISANVTIVLFDGEDYGPSTDKMFLGAKYYAAHLPTVKPRWGILLDMVGDKDLDIYREPNSEQYAKAVNDRVFTAATRLGYLRTATQPGFVNSVYARRIMDDHIPLIQAGVPMADLIDFNYPYWHTTADTVDKCSAHSLKIVGETVLYTIRQLNIL